MTSPTPDAKATVEERCRQFLIQWFGSASTASMVQGPLAAFVTAEIDAKLEEAALMHDEYEAEMKRHGVDEHHVHRIDARSSARCIRNLKSKGAP